MAGAGTTRAVLGLVTLLVCLHERNSVEGLRQQKGPRNTVLDPSFAVPPRHSNSSGANNDDALLLLRGGQRHQPSRSEGDRRPTTTTTSSPSKNNKVVSYALDGTVFDTEHDPLEQVIDFIMRQEEQHKNATAAAAIGAPMAAAAGNQSFLEVSAEVGKVHAFCEICILVMQMKERGQPHLCAGLNPDYFITCVENLESLLRADKAVVYWLRSGCMHLDREGPEIVRPCPAHAICAWVPNLFADVGIVTPRNELSPLCPRDFKYLPRIPRKPVQVATIN